MALTSIDVKNAKPAEKPYKKADEKGLYLYVNSVGRYWRLDYRFGGKRKTLALGVFPEVSLAEARTKRDEARKLLASGVDPSAQKKASKLAHIERSSNSFEMVAREWFEKFSAVWASNHSEKILRRLEKDIFPWLGGQSVAAISAPELLRCLRRIESRGAIETAHRALQNCRQIFRYAIATGRAERDPGVDLKGALPPVKERHHPSITERVEIGKLLRAIDGYQGSFVTRCALKLAPLVFVRPGELRRAEWSEIDLDGAEWRIPALRMKMREQHIVPLSAQAAAILTELQQLTGSGKYLFPGARTNGRPMSENTVNAALRRLGYSKNEMTGHGFRSMASTTLNELGWSGDAIERQLAHAERDGVRGAYNYAEYLAERRRMMQAWADKLDEFRNGGAVIRMYPGEAA